ncbi:MAG: TetR/AcrR family transcriptional regulator [candidate division Zixibacteria bacterium]|nr:TetR/AcrR family transcriptional regulator [candidate division Zixibacteria bacterium]
MVDENIISELVKRQVVNDTFRKLQPQKKELIYRQAIKLFGEYGYDGLSVDRLCRDAGISKGSFFQYFPSKSHLLEFALLVFDDYLARWVAEVRKHDQRALAKDRLMYLYQALILNAKLHQPEKKFYLFATNALEHSAVLIEGIDIERHFHDYIDEIISRGEKTGEIRGDFEVELTGHLVSIVMRALVNRQFSQRKTTTLRTGEYLISFLFDGIKA